MQFAWNTKDYFLGQVRKIFQMLSAEILPSMLSVKHTVSSVAVTCLFNCSRNLAFIFGNILKFFLPIYKALSISVLEFCYPLGYAMWKRVFGHMLTAKAQISAATCASTVWSGPSLSANRIIGCYRMYKWRAKAQMILCIWSESVHYEHVQRPFFIWHSPF